jgi:DnaJ domain
MPLWYDRYVDLREAYRVLEADLGASREVVRSARNLLARVWHPDRHQDDRALHERADSKLKQINAAYEAIESAGFPTRLDLDPPTPEPTDGRRQTEHSGAHGAAARSHYPPPPRDGAPRTHAPPPPQNDHSPHAPPPPYAAPPPPYTSSPPPYTSLPQYATETSSSGQQSTTNTRSVFVTLALVGSALFGFYVYNENERPLPALRVAAKSDAVLRDEVLALAAAKSTPRRDSNAMLRAQIGALRPQLVRCLEEHAGSISAALEGAAVVQINARGRVDAVEIKPAAIAATYLGACIRTIFSEQRFAAQRESLEITVPFSAKPRISP